MARNDRQFTPLGDVAAPASWTIPASVEIIPKAVSAVFDGSAAASAFLPTLDVISDSGVIVARVPTGSTVAAGGSAEVTWAPFLEAATALAPASSSTPFAVLDLAVGTGTFTAGGHAPNIATLKTNTAGASVFSLVGPPTSFVTIAQAGLYMIYACFSMSNFVTLTANTQFTMQVGTTGLVTTLPRMVDFGADTGNTSRFQDATGVTVEQFAAGDTARYIFFNGQTFNNVGPLGWAIWQITTDVLV